MKFDFIAPCYFGLESAAAFDFKRIGAENVKITDGRIAFSGDETVLANANLWSRSAERVMILLHTFPASTFD
ncbi:class I SAM-dependent RNA methyltransferase, partial [Ruminococcaceae bacterium OttesenSCG-928-A16]|nr:class I SAM-dependent RNA methyltransferase [Ruminococcaceae bacterium OttesenSCG-928-A16]